MDARPIVKLKPHGWRPNLPGMTIRPPIFNAVAASVLFAAIAGVAMIFVS